MNTQNHIQTLINQLSDSAKKHYAKVLHEFDFGKVDFSCIENWVADSYTRNCFYKDERFELILICWDKNQETSIHDHDGEDCWVYLLKGGMEEDFYRLNEKDELILTKTKVLRSNQITKSDKSSGFHRLRNSSLGQALSLHVYARPIEQSRTYDEGLGRVVEKKLSYDTFQLMRVEDQLEMSTELASP